MVKAFDEVPRDAERVIFFPRAAGGAEPGADAADAPRPQRHRASSSSRCCGRSRCRARGGARAPPRAPGAAIARLGGYDPGRERRAEQRAAPAAALVRQRRGVGDVPRPRLHPRLGRLADGSAARAASRRPRPARPTPTSIYPHKPIVAYLPQTGRLLNEYCVEFPDETRPYGSARLPDSDDVLAKWMALTGDERRLIASANMHLPGRQVDPKQVRRDLWRLQPVGARAPRTPRRAGASGARDAGSRRDGARPAPR